MCKEAISSSFLQTPHAKHRSCKDAIAQLEVLQKLAINTSCWLTNSCGLSGFPPPSLRAKVLLSVANGVWTRGRGSDQKAIKPAAFTANFSHSKHASFCRESSSCEAWTIYSPPLADRSRGWNMWLANALQAFTKRPSLQGQIGMILFG